MSHPQDFTDDEERGYEEKADRLSRFDAGLDAILREALGEDWLLEGAEAEHRLLTPRQLDWRELRFFYNVSIVNSVDLFRYLDKVYARPKLFRQIGAVKTLEAARKLRKLYDAYSRLPGYEEKNQFWWETHGQREPIEAKAEGLCEFADLLIRFAERYPKEFREIDPQWKPFGRMSEIVGSMRRKAGAAGEDTQKLDAAADLVGRLQKLFSNPDVFSDPDDRKP